MSLSDILKNIDLNTVGAAVKGLNAADEKITANKFKIRGADLAAKRDSLIKRKNANYEMELKSFYKEKEKADSIQSLNAESGLSTQEYASKWLSLTNPVYLKTTDANERARMENNVVTSLQSDANKIVNEDGTTTWKKKSYTAIGESKENLEAKYADQEAEITKIITDETLKQSQKSFLINKILGIKDEDTDIDAQIAAALKAEKKVKDLDDKGLTGVDGLTTTTVDKYSYKNTKKYETFAKDFNTKATALKSKDFLQKASLETSIHSLEKLNDNKINLEDYYQLDKNNEIVGLKGPFKDFVDLESKSVRQMTEYLNVDKVWKLTNGDIGKMAEYTDLSYIEGLIRERTINYANIYADGAVFGANGNLGNIITSEKHLILAPSANIINYDNQLVGTDITFTNPDTQELAGKLYGLWLEEKADSRAETSKRSTHNEMANIQDELMNKKYGVTSALSEEAIDFIKQGLIERKVITEERVTGKIHGPPAVDSKVPAFATVNKVKSLWIPAESTGTPKGIFIDLNDKETINQFKTADYEGKEAVVKLIEQHETEVVEKVGKSVETIKSVEISLEDKAEHFGIPLFVRAEGDTSKNAFGNWLKENPNGMMKHTFENIINQILKPITIGAPGKGRAAAKSRKPTDEEIQIRISELLKG